ncbi:G5 domain-containing protein [Agromyces mangrovi Wang et al. 2018]|uniref:G5 domain-containing protein n=1 Tax=Agromyces mangrovi TaxID=1858653 RepID=UPI0025726FEC|nr:G5 domain-containing protein [Agromyces mangrovi]BDZ64120.1 hypothetical protein GCM10025877_10580 [Agromyces mangrovi]
MANAKPGWYDDGSGRQRWWNGLAWTDAYLDSHAADVNKQRNARGFWIVAAVLAFVVAVLFVAIGGLGGLLILLGIVVGLVGLYALVRGSVRALRIRSRSTAILVLVGALVFFSAGASVSAADGRAQTTETSDASAQVAAGVDETSTPTPTPTPTPEPVITTETVEEREAVPFDKKLVDDSSLEKGKYEIRIDGKNGERTITYEVTYEDGVEISREQISDEVTIEPTQKVVAKGTYVPPPPPPPAPAPAPAPSNDCHPNYTGACVPIASDVDCAGGSGNGPAYVRGPVQVIGPDVYDLDRDGDGWACEW